MELLRSKVALFSDLHLGIKSNSPVWHKIAYDWALWFRDELKKRDITDIIFPGDFFDARDSISVNTLQFASELLFLLKDFNIILVVGNHDAFMRSSSNINSVSVFKGWKNITVVDTPITAPLFGKTVSFVPWGANIETIPSSDVIFGHFEIQSFKFNQFSICNSGLTSEQIFKRAPFVITGHFHLREYREYSNGNRILYCGNPFQMDFGDVDAVKGFHILDFETLTCEFIENTISPKHHRITLSELVRIGNLTPEVRERFRGNFIKLIIDRHLNSEEADFLIRKLTNLDPASLIIDYTYAFNKFKQDDANMDFSSVDIPTAIAEFTNLLEVPFKEEVIKYTTELYRRCK